MTLSTKDAQLFYDLWLPLLDYVNKTYKVDTSIKKMSNEEILIPAKVKEIADKIWGDVSIIDKYLTKYSNTIPTEHKEIIKSWKRQLSGDFVIERHLKKGSIFISLHNEQVYQVIGIVSSCEELFYYSSLPVIIKTTIIPFKDVIISDGVALLYDINLGQNMVNELKNIYMTAKENGLLHKTL